MKKEEKNETEQLFQRLKTGDKQVIEKIYSKNSKTVYGIAFSILKNKEDAEDVVQNVFSKLCTLDKEKLPENKEMTWLYTVTKNEALTLWRKNNNNTIDLDAIYDLEDKNDEIENIINTENYNKLISKLGNKEKEIVSLKILVGLSFEEISTLLGQKTGTVKWRYYKSLYRLKAMLSNLAMFIVTFAIGMATLYKEKTENQETNQVEDENQTIEKPESDEKNDQDTDKNLLENSQSNSGNLKDETTEEETNDIIKEDDIKQENTVAEDVPKQETNNYTSYSILSISFIFLIMAIIFTIFLKKYQLKLKKKSSK